MPLIHNWKNRKTKFKDHNVPPLCKAFLTPDYSEISLVVVFFPLYLLFILNLFILILFLLNLFLLNLFLLNLFLLNLFLLNLFLLNLFLLNLFLLNLFLLNLFLLNLFLLNLFLLNLFLLNFINSRGDRAWNQIFAKMGIPCFSLGYPNIQK